MSGGISGTGNLTVYGNGYCGVNVSGYGGEAASGLLVVTGGLNITGNIAITGAALYVPSMATLANNNVSMTAGGQIATSGSWRVRQRCLACSSSGGCAAVTYFRAVGRLMADFIALFVTLPVA